jgi:hypothetical protein
MFGAASQTVTAYVVMLVTSGIASIGIGLGYGASRRQVESHPLSPEDLEALRTAAAKRRFPRSSWNMEPIRIHSEPRYAARRERQYYAVAVGLFVVAALVRVFA